MKFFQSSCHYCLWWYSHGSRDHTNDWPDCEMSILYTFMYLTSFCLAFALLHAFFFLFLPVLSCSDKNYCLKAKKNCRKYLFSQVDHYGFCYIDFHSLFDVFHFYFLFQVIKIRTDRTGTWHRKIRRKEKLGRELTEYNLYSFIFHISV